MKAMIEYLVKEIVDEPEQVTVTEYVTVTETPGTDATVYEVRVAPSEVGKVVGKNGHMAKALRTLVNAVGRRNKQTALLDILVD